MIFAVSSASSIFAISFAGFLLLIYVYFSIYLCMLCALIFLAQMFWKSRFKIDVVIMIICSIVIIINSVLTLQVLTAKYPMIADLAK